MASEREGGGERKLNSGWAECCSELGGASSFSAPKPSSLSVMFSIADIWGWKSDGEGRRNLSFRAPTGSSSFLFSTLLYMGSMKNAEGLA